MPITRSGSCKNVADEAGINCGSWIAVYGKCSWGCFCAALVPRIIDNIERKCKILNDRASQTWESANIVKPLSAKNNKNAISPKASPASELTLSGLGERNCDDVQVTCPTRSREIYSGVFV